MRPVRYKDENMSFVNHKAPYKCHYYYYYWRTRMRVKFLALVPRVFCPSPQPPPWHSPTPSWGPSQVGSKGELCPWHLGLEHRVPSLLLQSQGRTELLGVAASCAPGQQHSGLDRLLWTALRTQWPRVTSFLWALALWVLNDWLCNYTSQYITYSRRGDCLCRTKSNCLNYGVSIRKKYKAMALP